MPYCVAPFTFAGVSSLFAGVPISFGVGGRYYATTPPGGPDWGLRFVVTLLLPE